MPPGFGVAVAEFAEVDANGRVSVTQASREISDKLYQVLSDENKQLPPALQFNLWGPDKVRAVEDATPQARDDHACERARQMDARVLIYGVLTAKENGYQVEPGFCVNDPSFVYGDEIRGPDRLGAPVPYQPALGKPAEQFKVNTQLEARFRALQHVIVGLAHYWLAQYDQAATEFQDVVDDPDWAALDGKEVIQVLMGAVQLRQYDSATSLPQRIEILTKARTSFAKAYELNPDYARSYLGLGATALQQALLDPPEQTDQLDAKLSEAYGWYTRTLMSQGFPAAAHLDAKAAYGLGQLYLLGRWRQLPGWSGEQAQAFFDQVLDAYRQKDPPPDLGWLAGHAECLSGYLAGLNGDWQTMSSRCRTGIDILDKLPGDPPRRWLAVYWSWIGYAEEQRQAFEAARNAYNKAIEFRQALLRSDQEAAADPDLICWKATIDRLQTPNPTGGTNEPSAGCDRTLTVVH
jgi:tetratricopeptide (TPR) repeat protein